MENFEQTSAHNEKSTEIPGFAQVETIPVGQRQAEFMRVKHRPETIRSFSEEIDQFIKDADVLITELAVPEEEEEMGMMKSFYHEIYAIARDYQTEMRVPDPEKTIIGAAMNRGIDITPMLAAVAAGIYGAAELKQAIKNHQEQRKYGNDQYGDRKRTMSRRSFLKAMGAGVIAAAGATNSVANGIMESGDIISEESVLENFAHASIEYRNACIALETLRAMKENKDVRILYGGAHCNGVKKFLENPDLIQESLAKYQYTYGVTTPPDTEIFTFQPTK